MRPDALPPDLLIAGASARAAAFSATRGGLRVAAADLFADEDLASVAEVSVIADWPAGIATWAERFPVAIPLFYVGGLENESELLDRFATLRPLLGNRGAPLRTVRNPRLIQSIFLAAGFRPPALSTPEEADRRLRWLVKPVKSAAGRGVRFWNGDTSSLTPGEYLQVYVEGIPGSAAFLAARGKVELLGTTELLLPDEPPLSDIAAFTYVGSITSDFPFHEPLHRLASCLSATGLQGLFGVDFIRVGDEIVPIEVNPRYTAGMEVLELRSGRSFIGDHVASNCRARWTELDRREILKPTGTPDVGDARRSHVGKRIIYAPQTLRIGALPLSSKSEILTGTYSFADVPSEGTVLPAGSPVCTVFAVAESVSACKTALKVREADVLAECEPVL